MDNRRILKEAMDHNREEITGIIRERELSLSKAPKGRLRISRRGKNIQYYQIEENGMRHGRYLKKEEANVAAALAQKSYDIQAVELLKQVLKEINGIDTQKLFDQVDQLYSNLSIERRRLVNPVRLSDSKYVELWEAVEYKGLRFKDDDPTDYYSDRGERVRSKSEVLIANKLLRAGIPYRFECPLQVKSGKIVYPDFMILNVHTRKEYYWEHFGRLDYPDYRADMLSKMEDYIDSGIFPGENLIITTETSGHPLKMWMIDTLIKKYCK